MDEARLLRESRGKSMCCVALSVGGQWEFPFLIPSRTGASHRVHPRYGVFTMSDRSLALEVESDKEARPQLSTGAPQPS